MLMLLRLPKYNLPRVNTNRHANMDGESSEGFNLGQRITDN